MPPLTKETVPDYGTYKIIYDKGKAAYDVVSKDHSQIGKENGVGEPIDEEFFKWTAEYAGYLIVAGQKIVRGNSMGVKNRLDEADLARAEAVSGISEILGEKIVDGGN